MIHLETQQITDLAELREFLQKAIELEHATIPPYLTAYYSLYGNINSEIQDSLKDVAIEEMLHMTLAANILIAIGGEPVIDSEDFVPDYPSKLPLGIGSTDPDKQLIVPLEAFSKNLLKNVFMEIEEPEHPQEFPTQEIAAVLPSTEFSFSTIGEFYTAIKSGLTAFAKDEFAKSDPEKQVDVHDSFGRFIDKAKVPAKIIDLASAIRAVDVIVEQGEGTEESPLDENSGVADDYAHYYRFAAIYHGRDLRQAPTKTQGFSYTGDRIGYDPDKVYPMIANLKLADLKANSDEYAILLEFNRVYSRMLQELHAAFTGDPSSISAALQTMRGDFSREARRVAQTRISPDSLVSLKIDELSTYHLTPSYERVEIGAEPGKTRFQHVIEILDNAIGGPNQDIGVHGAFWRDVSRDDFIAMKVIGLDLIILNDGANSNLVKALKGEPPFGVRFSRMPAAGLPPVPPEQIAFIETWIDEGCLEDPFEDDGPEDDMVWLPTNAPVASSRTDDIWFNDPNTGWAANSDGTIVHTKDGGESWAVQLSDAEVYFRSIGFADANRGWAGTLTLGKRLFMTDNGGSDWTPVTNLPDGAPSAICGICVLSRDVVFASGTNYPDRPAAVIKTLDGGATWKAYDMEEWADLLVDCFFTSPERGWVVGGKLTQQPASRDNIKPVVLFTEDGGETWDNRVADIQDDFPSGEWGWKIQFLDDQIGFVSLENLDLGAILKTKDGGKTWKRLPINDPQKNANLEGVGFINENVGWVGGWGDRNFERQSSSATTDGGETWRDANEIGTAINRFRFFGNPVTVGYCSGLTVYKYQSAKLAPRGILAAVQPSPSMMVASLMSRPAASPSVHIPVKPRDSKGELVLRIWDRFGAEVAKLTGLTADQDSIEWDLKYTDGSTAKPGHYILRVTDEAGHSESSILRLSE